MEIPMKISSKIKKRETSTSSKIEFFGYLVSIEK